MRARCEPGEGTSPISLLQHLEAAAASAGTRRARHNAGRMLRAAANSAQAIAAAAGSQLSVCVSINAARPLRLYCAA